MIKKINDTVQLHNGIHIPRLGLGVYKMTDDQETLQAIKGALSEGYRLIDTAAFYDNEAIVGEAVRQSGINRKDLFITSKVWNSDQGYDETLRAFEQSLTKLKMDYMDLYLIHWPVADKYKESWRAIERLYEEGIVKSIGVSNFKIHHLEDLMTQANTKPMVNQVELHPYLSQQELRDYCNEQQIAVEAWSPIARNRLADEPVLNQLANHYNKTVAQIILRWHLQNDVIIIPKSVHLNRLKENADLFDFELTADDMAAVHAINKNQRFGADPDTFDF
ncbi:diketogulonate reductase-like aldo/keto reductase [Bacillus ectoiniformans]|uniref:aldo/keto reductase n=1 Tax=Bacillus ectoiniformans TaxID=1494429 RepID=UPI00195DD50A|nr:aldo/keto reductase [Bacillus ectoiniformans]MBM7647661.1 diketogulonate reductase-like aldo/keto reductase [Bacillus ectoiniformans]